MDDPLNPDINVSDAETTFPVFPAQDYPCQCTKSAIEPNKARTGHNWNLEFTTVGPVTDVNGKSYNNTTFFVNNIALQSSENAKNPEGFKRNIASAIDALFGTSKGNRPAFNRTVVDQAVGKKCLVNVIIGKDNSGEDRNEVKKLKKDPSTAAVAA